MRALVDCQLWDGTGQGAVADGCLLIDGERIVAAGERLDLLEKAGEGTELVGLGGRFVMPGLIDAHVHLQFPLRGKGDFLLSLVEPIEFTTLKAARNAQVYLAAGVTTVMDCGCRGNMAVALREAIECGLTIGPRVVASGVPISPTGGWADDHADFIHNEYPQGTTADTPDEWRKEVRRQIKSGVDVIKIGISGSTVSPYSDPDASDLTKGEIEMIVQLAHAGGCRVAAHCHPAQGFVAALEAGVDTIHHGQGIDSRCLDALAASDAFFVPTAVKSLALAEDGLASGRPPDVVAATRARFESYQQMLAMLVERGLAKQIAVGSDAGNLPPPHGVTAREIRILVEAGMTADQALASATSVAAAAVGRTDVGSLAAGRLADFLVVDGDPLRDPSILSDKQRITAVYKGGELVAERGAITARVDIDSPFLAEPVYARQRRRRRAQSHANNQS